MGLFFFFLVGWAGFFLPIESVEESAFLFTGWLCLCSMEKVKLCGFTASA